MADWILLLTPLLVLPIVLLFRFVGCGDLQAAADDPPRYRDYIMGEPNNPGTVKNPGVVPDKNNVVAYWRLVDTGDTAKDEKGLHGGTYVTTSKPLPLEPPQTPPPAGGSEGAPGDFVTGEALIASDTAAVCHAFRGGYIMVPDHVESGPTEVDLVNKTHVAVTAANHSGGGKLVRLFVNGAEYSAPGSVVPTFSRPDGAPLYIGVANTPIWDVSNDAPRLPIISLVQEVVLHNKALAPEEIENHFNINRANQ